MTEKAKKRGKFSTDEENFITRNACEMDAEEIAKVLNRTKETVEKFIVDRGLRGHTQELHESHDILLSKLKHRPYYREIDSQLYPEELKYFEESWISLMVQFREDIMYSEELSLKQLILLDVLMSRSMKQRKLHEAQANSLQLTLDKELAKDDDHRDKDLIISIENQLAFLRAAVVNYTSEHTKLLGERKYIDKSLKATRDERIKRIEDGKTSFTGWLRELEDESQRKRWGDFAEIGKIAKNKAKSKLSEYHEFQDGGVDQPILSVDTLKEDE